MTKEKINHNRTGEGGLEKGSRWYRNFNAAVGAAALAGSVIVSPAVAVALQIYGGFNLAQAGLGEAGRRFAKNRREKK